jgi:hypothetical protein
MECFQMWTREKALYVNDLHTKDSVNAFVEHYCDSNDIATNSASWTSLLELARTLSFVHVKTHSATVTRGCARFELRSVGLGFGNG